MTTPSDLLKTPFHKFHVQHGAKLVDFAGWEMPLHYGSILDEHHQTRNSGGLFDVSHMGRIEITGRHARRFVETLVTRKVSDMPVKTARYALVCNPRGGVMDDVLVYRFDDRWLLVVNASNRAKLMTHFEAVAAEGQHSVKIDDTTLRTAMIAVQGPAVIPQIGAISKEIPTLKRYGFAIKNLLVLKMTVSRTGYTGEDGVEVMLGATMSSMAVKMLMKDAEKPDAPIKPAGLGARDTLRMEAGMPLYGHELDEDTDPFSAGLSFGVSLNKHETGPDDPPIPRFIGQDALEAIARNGPPRKLVGLKLDGRRTPRQGAEVSVGGQVVGAVTSGCLSPTLGHPIAMAYLPRQTEPADGVVQVTVGSQTLDAQLTALPFYKRK